MNNTIIKHNKRGFSTREKTAWVFNFFYTLSINLLKCLIAIYANF